MLLYSTWNSTKEFLTIVTNKIPPSSCFDVNQCAACIVWIIWNLHAQKPFSLTIWIDQDPSLMSCLICHNKSIFHCCVPQTIMEVDGKYHSATSHMSHGWVSAPELARGHNSNTRSGWKILIPPIGTRSSKANGNAFEYLVIVLYQARIHIKPWSIKKRCKHIHCNFKSAMILFARKFYQIIHVCCR